MRLTARIFCPTAAAFSFMILGLMSGYGAHQEHKYLAYRSVVALVSAAERSLTRKLGTRMPACPKIIVRT